MKEISIDQGLKLVLQWDKETSRAMAHLGKGDSHKMLITGLHKMELLDKYQGDVETFQLLKIIDQVRVFLSLFLCSHLRIFSTMYYGCLAIWH